MGRKHSSIRGVWKVAFFSPSHYGAQLITRHRETINMKLYLSYQTFETLFFSVPLEPSKDDLFIAEMIVVDAVSHLTDTW